MAIRFTRVVASGPGWVQVEADDGGTYTLHGTAAWRANNPGNLRPGSLTNGLGAIGVMDTGSNGKFLVFPDRETGAQAVPRLLFETDTYSSRSILEAFKKYAPTADHNDPASYAGSLAAAAGVDVNTRMGDLTPAQRRALLAAQPSVENNTPGRIAAADGSSVPPDVIRQFSAAPLPPMDIPDVGTQTDTKHPVDGSNFYDPHLDADGNYVGSPNRLRANTYPKSVSSTDSPAYDVMASGLGALSDPRTAALMDGPTYDPIGEGPSPIQLLSHHENEMGGLHFSTNVQPAAEVSAAAPVPMPGRPAQIDAKTAPTPMPGRPAALDAQIAPAATQAPAQTIRIGQHDYTVGSTFDQGGMHYVVTPHGIEKSRIPTGEPTVMSGVIGTILTEKAAQAAPLVKAAVASGAAKVADLTKQVGEAIGGAAGTVGHVVLDVVPNAIGNAVRGALKQKLADATGAVAGTVEKFGSGIGSLLSPLFHGAPASGLTVEHVGEQNGRPVLAVSGQAIISRAPPPAAVQFDAKVSRALIPAIAAQPTMKLPTTMNEALAGTNYAAAGAVIDQHFAKPDPILDSIHDKRDAEQMKAPQIVKAPPVSTSIVKPQGGTKPVEAPKPAPAAKQPANADDVGHPSTWGDFTKALSVPLPAPAKLVPPAQRTVVQPPARSPSVVVTTPSPTGVGSVRSTGTDAKAGHAAQPAPVAAATPTQPQVKTLPALQPVVEPHHTVIAQPTTQTAGAPVPIAAQNTQRAAAAAAPVYVDKATGAKLTPVTINSYNPDTQQWGTQTVYRPAAANAPAPAPAAVPAPQAQPFNYDQYAKDTFGVTGKGGSSGGAWGVGAF